MQANARLTDLEKNVMQFMTKFQDAHKNELQPGLLVVNEPKAILVALMKNKSLYDFIIRQDWKDISAISMISMRPPIPLDHGVFYGMMWKDLKVDAREKLVTRFREGLQLDEKSFSESRVAELLYYCLVVCKLIAVIMHQPAMKDNPTQFIQSLYELEHQSDYYCPLISAGELDDIERRLLLQSAVLYVREESPRHYTNLLQGSAMVRAELKNIRSALGNDIFDTGFEGDTVLNSLQFTVDSVVAKNAVEEKASIPSLLSAIFDVMVSEENQLRAVRSELATMMNPVEGTQKNIESSIQQTKADSERLPYLKELKQKLANAPTVSYEPVTQTLSKPPLIDKKRKMTSSDERLVQLCQMIFADPFVNIPPLASFKNLFEQANQTNPASYRQWLKFSKALQHAGGDWVRETRDALENIFNKPFAEQMLSVLKKIDQTKPQLFEQSVEQLKTIYVKELSRNLQFSLAPHQTHLEQLVAKLPEADLNQTLNFDYQKEASQTERLLAANNRIAEFDKTLPLRFDPKIRQCLLFSDSLQLLAKPADLHNRILQLEADFERDGINSERVEAFKQLQSEFNSHFENAPETFHKVQNFLNQLHMSDNDKIGNLESKLNAQPHSGL